MNNRKNQNSILVLATLGVYLGLVLAGATPQVLAQAAMTKQFNVKDEIAVNEDLDKKPSDKADDSLTESIHIYLRDLHTYLSDVRKADEYLRSVYDPTEARIAGNYVGFYKRDPEPVVLTPCHKIGDANHPFNFVGNDFVRTVPILLNPEYNSGWSWSWTSECRRLDRNPSEKIKFAGLEVSGPGNQKGAFTYQLSVSLSSTSEAATLFSNLAEALKRFDVADLCAREKVLWENTKLTTADDTVFIVTRLPRGSLDSLLATDAK